jgi:hypothetical protein
MRIKVSWIGLRPTPGELLNEQMNHLQSLSKWPMDAISVLSEDKTLTHTIWFNCNLTEYGIQDGINFASQAFRLLCSRYGYTFIFESQFQYSNINGDEKGMSRTIEECSEMEKELFRRINYLEENLLRAADNLKKTRRLLPCPSVREIRTRLESLVSGESVLWRRLIHCFF